MGGRVAFAEEGGAQGSRMVVGKDKDLAVIAFRKEGPQAGLEVIPNVDRIVSGVDTLHDQQRKWIAP